MNRVTTIVTCILICSCIPSRVLVDQSDFLDTSLFFKMKQNLAVMCPGVDICDRNKTQPDVSPNRLLGDSDDIVSCCEGCSCNERCHEKLNCCFPSNDNFTKSDRNKYTSLECMYVQTGTPDADWPGRVPAYRIVTSAPTDGCNTDVSCPALNGRGLTRTCDRKQLLPWGDLFPVYSIEHDAIYINELCACCHGAGHVKPWKPFLICDEYSENKRPLSLSEHLQFVDNNFDESHCSVTFRYPYPSVLVNKHCSLHTKSTCESVQSFRVPPNSNLTTEEVVQACESGLAAPIMIRHQIFQNVFCAVCSRMPTTSRCKFTKVNDIGKLGYQRLSLLLSLDADLYRPGDMIVKRRDEQHNPQACIKDTEQMWKGCRSIFCPSGQIRNREGQCTFTTTAWHKELFSINIKVEYVSHGKDFWTMILDNETSISELSQLFQESSPWSSHWTSRGMMLDVSGVHGNIYTTTTLICSENNPKVLYEDLMRSIGQPWKFFLNNSSYIGQQSLLNYLMVYPVNNTLHPRWTIWNDQYERLDSFPTTHGYHAWKKLNVLTTRIRPTILYKTFICTQVALQPDEYMLMADDRVLASNLTLRVLFDAEFDLVQDKTRSLTARVCIDDTVFKTREEINNSSLERSTKLIFIALGITVFWIGV